MEIWMLTFRVLWRQWMKHLTKCVSNIECPIHEKERRLMGAYVDTDLGCRNVFLSVMAIINSIYLSWTFSFCHQRRGYRKKEKEREVEFLAFRDLAQVSWWTAVTAGRSGVLGPVWGVIKSRLQAPVPGRNKGRDQRTPAGSWIHQGSCAALPSSRHTI